MELKRQCGGRGPGGGTGARSAGQPGLSEAARGSVASRGARLGGGRRLGRWGTPARVLHPSGLPFICWLCCSLSLPR